MSAVDHADWTDTGRKLRVRTGKIYHIRFDVDLGQRNAVMVKRSLCPLANGTLLRFFPWLRAADAVAMVGPGYDLIHSKNAIPVLTRAPFIVTFEDYLPRVPEDRYVGWLERWLQEQLTSSRCIALLAESHYAMRQFKWQNRNFHARALLEAKTEVLYPAVACCETPKGPSNTLKLLFVGADFLRKGGPVVVRAHERLKRKGIPVSTTVISSLRWSVNDYIGPPSPSLASAEHDRLRRSGIRHHAGLPNAVTLQMIREADYLVLPTFHDTFGYAAIEALGCATPVIATATCAQPEIVEDGQCGFLLPFENEPIIGKWIWTNRTAEPGYVEAYMTAVERLGEALAERLAQCWERRSSYEEMSANCLTRIHERFDRDKARRRLEELYRACDGRH